MHLPYEYSHQGVLEKVVHELFVGRDIITNTQKPVRNPVSGKSFEIDVWVPSLSLGFEFQDLYHFGTAWYYHRPLTTIQDRDIIKRDVIHEQGKTLVQVPYWWNSAPESLVASIRFLRPELLLESSSSCPIPLNPPNFSSMLIVPDIGELMLASVVHSVAALDETFEPPAWWMGEKYDGVRCIWNNFHRALYTRRAQQIDLPQSHHAACTQSCTFLDGELWCGRGSFLSCQTLVIAESETNHTLWAFARLVAFDDPCPPTSSMTFEDRYGNVSHNVLDIAGPFVVVATRVKCTSKHHIAKVLQQILQDDGEGVIIRRSKSMLEHGRSGSLIKIKTMRGDAEALVIGITADSCKLKMPNGTKFTVATSTIKPDLGDMVTLEYDSYSQRNIPVNPSVVRIRKELSWDDALLDYSKELKQTVERHSKAARTVKPAKYWSAEKGKHMRAFFEDFARSLNLSPLLPDTWYSIPRKTILQEKEARSFLVGFGGNHVKALMAIFPDLNLEASSFSTLPSKFWNNINNRREFFNMFAAQESFDPLIAHNWYSVKRENIASQKGYLALVLHYRRDFISALLHLYPDIGLIRDGFQSWNYWREAGNRRNFFNKIAERFSFSPLIAHNWYPFTQRQITEFEDGPAVLRYHQNNFITALTQLYSKIGLVKTLFHEIYWGDETNRRIFFDEIACEGEFEPLVPENWYWLPRTSVTERKDGSTVLSYHRNDYTLALKQLYPQIGLIRAKFKRVTFYRVRRNRHRFFDSVSTKMGFDPLVASNWYTLPKQSILMFKDGPTVLSFYKNNLSQALKRLYPDLSFDRTKFQARDVYQNPNKRLGFFKAYAQANQFDPLEPGNWYLRTKNDILSFKAGRVVLRYYKNLPSALTELYPQLAWDVSKFQAGGKDWRIPAVRRSFFDAVARELGIDPLVPSNWFPVSIDTVMHHKGAYKMLQLYKKNLSEALVDTYPSLEDHSNFSEKYHQFQKYHKRLVEFAKERSFDPLDAENWYSITSQALVGSVKGSKVLLEAFDGDVARAIEFLFPKIGIAIDKFPKDQMHSETSTPRMLFDKFAESNSFDPLLPDNWYKITRSKISSMKGSEMIMSMYGTSLSQTLVQSYPDVDLNLTKFKFVQKQYWQDEENQRTFFTSLAKEKGFDPLKADNWYSCSYWDIQGQKKASSVLAYYNGNYRKALVYLFPNLALEEDKFVHM